MRSCSPLLTDLHQEFRRSTSILRESAFFSGRKRNLVADVLTKDFQQLFSSGGREIQRPIISSFFSPLNIPTLSMVPPA